MKPLTEQLTEFNIKYRIQLGVISEKTEREESDGITNAEIMYINENGSALRHIPARPVLQMTIDYFVKHQLDKAIDKMTNIYLETNSVDELEKAIDIFCQRMQSYAQTMIYDYDKRLTPNAPSTIKKKGFDHPLFVTGQLARSITSIYSRIK